LSGVVLSGVVLSGEVGFGCGDPLSSSAFFPPQETASTAAKIKSVRIAQLYMVIWVDPCCAACKMIARGKKNMRAVLIASLLALLTQGAALAGPRGGGGGRVVVRGGGGGYGGGRVVVNRGPVVINRGPVVVNRGPVVVGRGPVVVGGYRGGVRYVDYNRRPAIIVENYGRRPGYYWARGDWAWNGSEWIWGPGHYMVDPAYGGGVQVNVGVGAPVYNDGY
jgi:hypothetical protein